MSDDKIKQLEELIEIDPGDDDLPFLLGKALLDAGRYEESAARLAEASRRLPDLAAVWRWWGQALRDRGEPGEARRVWTEGIALAEKTGDLQAGKEMKVFLKRLGGEG